jgi:deoxyribodipyrimidine photo-lyase
MIQPERIECNEIESKNNAKRVTGKVVYWMQSAQRLKDNHALAYAIQKANELQQPLEVIFVLVADFPNANTRHYRFMLEGLKEVDHALSQRGILFQMVYGDPAIEITKRKDIGLLVMDDAYLTYESGLKAFIADQMPCKVVKVSTNVVVPVECAYPKAAFGAYVIRKPILSKMGYFSTPVADVAYHLEEKRKPLPDYVFEIDWQVEQGHLTCPPLVASSRFKGGYSMAIKQFQSFLRDHAIQYDTLSNDPDCDIASHMSPYLHFGQISPVTLLNLMWQSGQVSDGYIEQLVVRRELAFNYVYYDAYDKTLEAILPTWAYDTLKEHRSDMRQVTYPLEILENAMTHDPYWNAAQRQLVGEGIMHNYMRMYWGKKVIEWTEDPDQAYEWLVILNDKYALDGRDPNGYAGIAWCFGKHDRAWRERAIFGKVRYMNDKGLKRKFKMTRYLEKYRKVLE